MSSFLSKSDYTGVCIGIAHRLKPVGEKTCNRGHSGVERFGT
jgi:hypothetical protein